MKKLKVEKHYVDTKEANEALKNIRLKKIAIIDYILDNNCHSGDEKLENRLNDKRNYLIGMLEGICDVENELQEFKKQRNISYFDAQLLMGNLTDGQEIED